MLKKLLAGVITAVLSLGAVALIAGPASAHHNVVDVAVSCATDGSGYKVTWGVTNSEGDKTEVITASNLPAAVNANLGFGERKEFLQFVSEPQDLSLTVTGYWASTNVTHIDGGSLSAGAFPTGCLKVSAAATPSPSVCDGPNHFTDPSYTLTAVTGVQYTVGGTTTPGGVFPVSNGTSVHIEASVTDAKYSLVGTTVWDFSFTEPSPACTVKVVPVKPIVTQAVCTGPGDHDLAYYTITAVTGVLYYVKIDGGAEQPVSAGKHDIPDGTSTVQVIAKGDVQNYYVIDGDPVVYDVETINPAGLCLKLVIPLEPDPINDACDALAPGVIPSTTYTLFYVEHIIYEVSVNNGAPVDVILTQNTTFNVVPRDARIHVTARVDDPTKYEMAPWAWTMVFFDFGDCKTKLTPLEPLATDQFCEDDAPLAPAGKTSLTLMAAKVQHQGTITIPATPAGVQYFLDGVPQAAGVYTVAPGVHEVTAAVIDGSTTKLDPAIVLPFTFDIQPGLCEPDLLVVPAASSNQVGCFSAGSYTLSNNVNDPNAIIWTVNGTQVAPGKYTVSNSGTVTIVAAANTPDYGLEPGVQTTWTVDFKKPTVCDLETLALTGQSPTGLLIVADLFVVTGLALFAVRAMRRRPEMI
jgi:hypothetical protein